MSTPQAGRRTKIRARDVFEAYFLKHHRDDLTEILEEKQDVEQHYPVFVNFLTMFEEHTEVAESLLSSPAKLLPVLNLALFRASTKLLDELKLTCTNLSLKTNLHARITGLPSCPELYRDRMPRTADVGRLLCVVGTVVRRTSAKMLEYQKEFMCAKCKHVFTVVADHDQYYQLSKPGRCPNPTECHSTYFTMLTAASQPIHTKDYQELKIQEQVQKLKMGSIPSSMWVTLEDDLVDSCRPGDDVVVCGVVRRRWRPLVRDSRPCLDLVVRANNVTVDNKERSGSTAITEEMRQEFAEFWEHHRHSPLTGRNIILASICPEVYGLYVVKMALAVVVAGGVQKTGSTTTRIRGEAHLLLVGDPGTAKSQFLKYASSLVPRSVFTTGTGTTTTGLTVTVVREDGDWGLEAGALVMADGGVCCIDEFSSVREADRGAIHEAMEQQTISVAKAGLLCKLDSRCSVLAATNPKEEGNSDDTMDFIGLASPLLSRFDLVLVLQDMKNKEWDRVVSEYILKGQDPGEAEGTGGEEDWGLEKLRAYFCVIRSVQPKMTPQANEVLSRYYQVQRQSDHRSKARTTIRLLESLVRLSQGHARLLMRGEVGVQDAVVAISLLEASMGGFSAVMDINPLYTAFPQNVQLEYRTQVQVILQKLCLPEVLRKELARLDEDDLAIIKLSGTHRRKDQPTLITSTQKLPSTSVLQSRKDFKATVGEESFALDIEELHETTDRRKRPRGGIQQTLNQWVEPDTHHHSSDDDLEIIKPRKQRSKREEERGKSVQTQVKNVKRKRVRRKVPKERAVKGDVRLLVASPVPSPPSSVSHVDRAGEDLLNDLDDFADETRTPNNVKENFISTIAKFAYRKPGKETKQLTIQDPSGDKEALNKSLETLAEEEGRTKSRDENVLKTCSINKCLDSLKEKQGRMTGLTEIQKKSVVSDRQAPSNTNRREEHIKKTGRMTNLTETQQESAINTKQPTPSPSSKETTEPQNLIESPIVSAKAKYKRDKAIAQLKRFSYLPPDGTLTASTQNTKPSETERVGEASVGECEREKESEREKERERESGGDNTRPVKRMKTVSEEKLSLTHAKIKEAREKRLNLTNSTTQGKINHSETQQNTSSYWKKTQQNNISSSDSRIRENISATDQTRDSDNGDNIKKSGNYFNQPTKENVRDTDEPLGSKRERQTSAKPRHTTGINDQSETGELIAVTERIHQENTTNTTPILEINTPPSSSSSFSSSSSSSSYFPTKPNLTKKRFSFALNEESEEEDIDLFNSPITQGRESERCEEKGEWEKKGECEEEKREWEKKEREWEEKRECEKEKGECEKEKGECEKEKGECEKEKGEYEKKKEECEKEKKGEFEKERESEKEKEEYEKEKKGESEKDKREWEKEKRECKSVTPHNIPQKISLFTPSPVMGRLKLPVVGKGADKYEALASDELDDFDFDL